MGIIRLLLKMLAIGRNVLSLDKIDNLSSDIKFERFYPITYLFIYLSLLTGRRFWLFCVVTELFLSDSVSVLPSEKSSSISVHPSNVAFKLRLNCNICSVS